MKKILILAISLMGTLALTGCGKPKTEIYCEGGSAHATTCRVRVTFKTAEIFTNFDASQARINLSQSNINVISGTGTIALNIKNPSGQIITSSVFAWHSSGSYLYPTNPSAISSWINANMQTGYSIDSDVSGIDMTGGYGNNVATAILEYGSDFVGASASFYLNNADINRF